MSFQKSIYDLKVDCIADKPATGASGIQALTRKDTETENVVVLICQKRGSSSKSDESEEQCRRKLQFDSNKDDFICDEVFSHHEDDDDDEIVEIVELVDIKDNKITSTVLSSRKISSKSSLSSKQSCGSCDTETDNVNNVDDVISTASDTRGSTECADGQSDLCEPLKDNKDDIKDTISKVNSISDSKKDTGAIPKVLKTNDSVTTSVKSQATIGPEVNDDDSVKEIHTDKETDDVNPEDKLIWELLKSMRSPAVDNGCNDQCSLGTEVVQCRPGRKDSSDSCGSVCTDKEEKDRDKYISEKLQRQQSGDVTRITFLSPSNSTTNFIPLKKRQMLTIPLNAKDVFLKHVDEARDGLQSSGKIDVVKKDHTSLKVGLLTKTKLCSPKFVHDISQINEQNR